MVIVPFLVKDKNGRFHFFEETFQLADINIYVALGMFFLFLSNVEINLNN